MLLANKKNDTLNYNIFNNIDKFYVKKNNFFSVFQNINSLQEVWLKSIQFNKHYFIAPFCPKLHLLNKKKFNSFYALDNKVKKYKNDQIAFIIIDKYGTFLGYIELIYFEEQKSIAFKSLNYSSKKVLKVMKHGAVNLIEYFRKTCFIDKFVINIDENNKQIIKYFNKIGFVKAHKNNKEENKRFNYVWKDKNINIGNKLILTAGPSVSVLESFKSYDAAKNGWNNNWNKYIEYLETNFAKYLGVKHAISTSSCTGALHIALMALGIKEGDEVIVPDITWVATARVVSYLGAIPVFSDIKKESWNINTRSVESLINKKTKAIIAVHLYGNPADLIELRRLSNKYRIKLVEDAAPALGASYNGVKCGTVGDFSAFSFQGAKLLVAGEGGMLCTNNTKLYRKAKKISDHGRNPKKTFWIDGPGLKYKISNIQAAFASGQLDRINNLILMKRRIFEWYKEFLRKNKHIILVEESQNCYSNYWMNSIHIINNEGKKRDKLINYLKKNNIDSRPVFSPISEYPIWNKSSKINKTAKLIGYSSLNLPSGTSLTKNEVKYICKKINLFFNL